MNSKELRQKFLKFFEDRGHTIIPSATLVPTEKEQLSGKEKVLFTSAGMQPLIPYLLGKRHPKGSKLVDVQKCFRTDDINLVGDDTHHTFFEMLGNWSLGDYWKEEAIEMSFQFLTRELDIPLDKLAVSVFAGDKEAPRDEESAAIWKRLGISQDRIFYLGKEENWWPTGEQSGPCGPDTEMFYWIGKAKPEGYPGKNPYWVEIWNDVFMQFNRKPDGILENLSQKNVDTGMGLERALAVLTGKRSAYETDIFLPIIEEIRKGKENYDSRSERIIADHLRAAVFLISDGVKPLSKDPRGSVVKRIITNALTQEGKQLSREILDNVIGSIITNYQDQYKELETKSTLIYQEIHDVGGSIYQIINGPFPNEIKRHFLHFKSNLPLSQASYFSGKTAFDFQQSYGFPGTVSSNIAQGTGVYSPNYEKGYEDAFKRHQEFSRQAQQKTKGGLAVQTDRAAKLHTATHLLHQALRDVLGHHVHQTGSHITDERLRFDFTNHEKLTEEQIKKVEQIVNLRIKENLKVYMETMPKAAADELDAIGLFDEKYGDLVNVYYIAAVNDPKVAYSKEFCGGPHAKSTGDLGSFRIIKEESAGSGVRRIYATVE